MTKMRTIGAKILPLFALSMVPVTAFAQTTQTSPADRATIATAAQKFAAVCPVLAQACRGGQGAENAGITWCVVWMVMARVMT
ncbi:MAG: hypothetical protein RL367_1966 [Pseudomonadota bacterium]|jgi:hypothetical protein